MSQNYLSTGTSMHDLDNYDDERSSVDLTNDHNWLNINPRVWVYQSRFSWRNARICIVEKNAWTVYIGTKFIAQVESWEEAKGLASLMFKVKETE